MKLTPSITALAAILGLALAGVPSIAQAQTAATPAPVATAAPAPAAKSAKPSKIQYEGTVTAIDTAASTITVTIKKASKVLAIASTTKIKKDGKPATLADFAAGEKVTGSYTADASGKLTAASLHTKTAKAAAATTAKTAPVAKPAATPTAAPAAQ